MKLISFFLITILSCSAFAQKTNFNYFDEDTTLFQVNTLKCKVKKISFDPKNANFNYFDVSYDNKGNVDSCVYVNMFDNLKVSRKYSYFDNGKIKSIESKVFDKKLGIQPFTLKKYNEQGKVILIEIHNAKIESNETPITAFTYDSQNRLSNKT